MIKARNKRIYYGLYYFLSDYLTEDCTLSVVGASADFAEVLNTAVININTTATATPVKPNPFEERFIVRLLLFKLVLLPITSATQFNSCNQIAFPAALQ